jgi:uncharacterized protein (DUF983 family)
MVPRGPHVRKDDPFRRHGPISMSRHPQIPSLAPVLAIVRGRCPRCGGGKLFKWSLTLQPSCSACGLAYDFGESDDGPAVFVVLIGGAIVIGGALWTEVTYAPPLWIEMAVFLPATLIVCLGLLRPFKALLIGLQYATRAGEGRLK